MLTVYRYLAAPDPCAYLPDQVARMEYEQVAEMSAEEYAERLLRGWRRFGHALFRPRCPHCSSCRSLRVDVARFVPNRSQKRVARANEGRIERQIGEPTACLEVLQLSHRFHDFRSLTRGWPWHVESASQHMESFVSNPFPTEEWRYTLDDELVGVGYVDALPVGLSAIYFVHDPAHQDRSLGTWNVLCSIEEARARGLPYLYLGYHVADCLSLAYKASFRPHQILGPDGAWHDADETERAIAGEIG